MLRILRALETLVGKLNLPDLQVTRFGEHPWFFTGFRLARWGTVAERIHQLKGVGFLRVHLFSCPWTDGFLNSGYLPEDLCW